MFDLTCRFEKVALKGSQDVDDDDCCDTDAQPRDQLTNRRGQPVGSPLRPVSAPASMQHADTHADAEDDVALPEGFGAAVIAAATAAAARRGIKPAVRRRTTNDLVLAGMFVC